MKRILSLMLVLLLLFSAGCKQQDADPATPGEVVERTETETPETDLPEVIEQEENAPTDTETEQTPSTEDETKDKANNSTTSTSTEDDFDKEAWLKEYLVTAEQIYDQMEELVKLTNDEIRFGYEITLTDYPESVYWQTNLEYDPDKIPSSVKWYTPLDPLPDFSMIASFGINEGCHKFTEKDPKIWTRRIYISAKATTKEALINDVKTLASLNYVLKFKVVPLYSAIDD